MMGLGGLLCGVVSNCQDRASALVYFGAWPVSYSKIKSCEKIGPTWPVWGLVFLQNEDIQDYGNLLAP